MSETNETADKTLRTERKPLSLKRTVESGHVRQSFSHGRSKSVVVEKKKKRTINAPGEAEEGRGAEGAPVAEQAQRVVPDTARGAGGLSTDEMDARTRALRAERERAEAEARERERLAAQQEPVAVAPPVQPETPLAAAPEPQPDVKAEARPEPPPPQPAPTQAPPVQKRPEARPAAPATTVAKGDEKPAGGAVNMSGFVLKGGDDPRRPPVIETKRPTKGFEPSKGPEVVKRIEPQVKRRAVEAEAEEEESRAKKKGGVKGAVKSPVKAGEERRERTKLTINNAFDEAQRERSLASLKRRREREKMRQMGIVQPRDKVMREVIIPEVITIQELANRMTERSVDVIKLLMQQGAMHKINDVIDADTAELIVREFGHTPKRVSESDVEEGLIGASEMDEDSLEPRAPVVTIMGHVDHGKTSLLDAIRSANVAAGEAGGITQHIGAYQVSVPSGGEVTFIDTPGHEAFTAMRARGAKVTDIVVLVVAADDGVMPQTVEAINHAKAAGVPMIVAINKIDKPGVDPNRVRTELLQHEVIVESMSGETLEVEVSALKRINLDKLLEAIHLQAELLDLRANPNRSAEGVVIEAKLERGRGPVGTALVQRGTLHVGDIVVAGKAWGRVRALIDDRGDSVNWAGPSEPVEILGFDTAPEAGDPFAVVESEGRAREITDYRVRKRRQTLGSAGTARTLEQMMQQLKEAGRSEFPLVVKGDVQGSVEAIAGSLKKVGNDEVEARIVHSGVGGITESDIALANASKAIVIGFNVRANAQAKAAADQTGVEIRYYNIIYDLVDDVKKAMSGLLAPTVREVFLGNAEILEVFNISKIGKVAGCRISEGKVERGAKVRLIRDNVVIHEGTLSTLKRFKDEVKEVPAGQECGMAFANYQDIRAGDVIECYNVETIARSL
ncbi:MAG: translation initiation factor IF-2 [Hyphomicrobiaceae bacterium]|nr:translation initiation factor IF-2 [Hyphomicrobiaceae bacterium]